jgi:hypothetical protein
MAAVLQGCITEEHRSVVGLLWATGLNAKNINKEMFPVHDGKSLSRKAIHNWITSVSLMMKWLKRRS